MTGAQKKQLALVALFAIVAVLLWLLRRGSQTVIQQGGGLTLGGFSLPGFNMPPRGPPISLPPFGTNEADFSMIGACCSDCSGRTTGRQSYMPASPFTYVYNEGNKGPNIFVYYPPAPPKPKSFMSASFG
jgi:hypothetical protein